MAPLIPDVQSFANFLQRCYTTKNLQTLRQLHAQTIKLRISIDEHIRAKLIAGYSACSEISDAQFIFSICHRRTPFLYNTLIRGYAQTKDFNRSLACFGEMIYLRKEINSATLCVALKAVAALSALQVGKRIHGYGLVRGFGSDLASCNSLITMYGKCGDVRYARKVFDELPERNIVSWNSMMGVYGMHGEFNETFRLFDELLGLGVYEPDEWAFTAVLTACSHGGRLEKGIEYFEMMERFGLRPTLEHYTCMVDMLGRAGRLDEAKQLMMKMDMEPDEPLLRAWLGACKFHNVAQIPVKTTSYYPQKMMYMS